jgi:hypothetical protein
MCLGIVVNGRKVWLEEVRSWLPARVQGSACPRGQRLAGWIAAV